MSGMSDKAARERVAVWFWEQRGRLTSQNPDDLGTWRHIARHHPEESVRQEASAVCNQLHRKLQHKFSKRRWRDSGIAQVDRALRTFERLDDRLSVLGRQLVRARDDLQRACAALGEKRR